MKKIYLLPNVITAFGLSCGLFIIFKMTMMGLGEVDHQALMVTAGILILAAVADLLDGLVARIMKAESSFGGFFDSLSDAITFGVSPTVIVLKTLSASPGTELSFWLTSGAMVFSVCGVLRLVRFSTTPNNDELDVTTKHFTGVPIPAAAAGIVSLNLFLASSQCQGLFGDCDQFHATIMVMAFFVLGYFMISRWKFPSLKGLRWRVASFRHVFITVLVTVLLFYGLLNHFPLIFLILVWGYLLLGWTLSIIRIISGRNSKTLVDFEPDPEE